MPILFADKRKGFVAALHCGRKGLGKGIIKNLIQILKKKRSAMEDILVAIGPSISWRNYSIDIATLKEFHEDADIQGLLPNSKIAQNKKKFNTLNTYHKQDLIQLDLRKYAHMQLLNENIPNTNIEISNLCTYESTNEFNSWRRTKTASRQWNFISPNNF